MSSISLPLTASDRSLSAVEAGEFLLETFLTRERDDFGGRLRLVVVGVPRRDPLLPFAFTELALGPTLPALETALVAGTALPLGVPGPREACRARLLD